MAADVQHQVADAARPEAHRDDEPDDAPAARGTDGTELRADHRVGFRLGVVHISPDAVVVDVVDGKDGCTKLAPDPENVIFLQNPFFQGE